MTYIVKTVETKNLWKDVHLMRSMICSRRNNIGKLNEYTKKIY